MKDKVSVKQEKGLTSKSKNISKWYNEVVLRSELADYGPAKGTMVIRPYGFAIWENIQKGMDAEIKKAGIKNAYFPLLIPESLLNKEKEHVQGFSPELAVVTHAGGEDLAEKMVIRPTSEMIMYDCYARWISSWRDLPLILNQWNNVVRWEKRTYLFLRTSEFLWQEGHGAHATHEESLKTVYWAMEMYKKIYTELLAIPGLIGKKSEGEKFPGALDTITYEILIPSGKALQGCTSHDLGQNFSKVLDIKYQNKEGKSEYVWQNSWGFATRAVGALALVHGDDRGLVVPPKLAPVKAVILPIFGKQNEAITTYCQEIKKAIETGQDGFPGEVEIWTDQEKSYGWKANEAELKGIPLRITVGAKELEEKTVTINKRIGGKEPLVVGTGDLAEKVRDLLKSIQIELFEQANTYLKSNTTEVRDYSDFKSIMNTKRGIIKAFWCEGQDCEEKIKSETKASTRCLPLEAKEEEGQCIYCGKKADHQWYFALAY